MLQRTSLPQQIEHSFYFYLQLATLHHNVPLKKALLSHFQFDQDKQIVDQDHNSVTTLSYLLKRFQFKLQVTACV